MTYFSSRDILRCAGGLPPIWHVVVEDHADERPLGSGRVTGECLAGENGDGYSSSISELIRQPPHSHPKR